jgi:hypothetical protein
MDSVVNEKTVKDLLAYGEYGFFRLDGAQLVSNKWHTKLKELSGKRQTRQVTKCINDIVNVNERKLSSLRFYYYLNKLHWFCIIILLSFMHMIYPFFFYIFSRLQPR